MKKITAGILTAALVIALVGATVSAVGLGTGGAGELPRRTEHRSGFIRTRTASAIIMKTVTAGEIQTETVSVTTMKMPSALQIRMETAPATTRENISGTASAADGTYGCGNGWRHSSGLRKWIRPWIRTWTWLQIKAGGDCLAHVCGGRAYG